MNRTERLADAIKKIAQDHKEEIKALSFRGKLGGTNAAHIAGWKNVGVATITVACKMARVPTLNYWSGSAPTPSTSIPECIAEESYKIYKQIFDK